MIEVYGYSIATIPVITAMVYGFIELFKYIFANGKPTVNKYIPIVAAVLGGAFAVGGFYLFPGIILASTWYTALAMGMASGLSAVGVHQIKKQFTKEEGKNE